MASGSRVMTCSTRVMNGTMPVVAEQRLKTRARRGVIPVVSGGVGHEIAKASQ
ncbi:hypothetical protein [Streptosporangium sp. CA-115845]|uniref:hypothetical protein n=1 Tax=Streptosporangium sp. CA-115845 TaxID=3240071 RepID=UPI003D9065DF